MLIFEENPISVHGEVVKTPPVASAQTEIDRQKKCIAAFFPNFLLAVIILKVSSVE
jgi:hypothetical protein